jgi:hypothetical protein
MLPRAEVSCAIWRKGVAAMLGVLLLAVTPSVTLGQGPAGTPTLVGAIQVSRASGSVGTSSAGPCSIHLPYHYAFQYTSTSDSFVNCAAGPAPYYGWNGIEGGIATAAGPVTNIDFSADHAAAFLALGFYNATNPGNPGWIQIGWAVGTINCPGLGYPTFGPYTSPHLYVETFDPAAPNVNCGTYPDWGWYWVQDLGPMPTSASFQITYQGSGCWGLAVTPSGASSLLTSYTACNFAAAGEAEATLELSTLNQSAQVPTTVFGGSDLSSGALYLHGASGWIKWQTYSIMGWHTGRYDERYNDHPCMKISHYLLWYKFLGVAAPTSC